MAKLMLHSLYVFTTFPHIGDPFFVLLNTTSFTGKALFKHFQMKIFSLCFTLSFHKCFHRCFSSKLVSSPDCPFCFLIASLLIESLAQDICNTTCLVRLLYYKVSPLIVKSLYNIVFMLYALEDSTFNGIATFQCIIKGYGIVQGSSFLHAGKQHQGWMIIEPNMDHSFTAIRLSVG